MNALPLSEQALLLTTMAHEARLVRLALDDPQESAQKLARDFEQAIEQAIDADVPAEAIDARRAIEAALIGLQAAGLKVDASLSAMEIEGVLGTARLPVLTAVVQRG